MSTRHYFYKIKPEREKIDNRSSSREATIAPNHGKITRE